MVKRVEHLGANFSANAFAGTATYYVRYRVPYPDRLLRDLVARSGASAEGRLLDIACGPARVALALASSFREIWAIDLEPEMIEAGKDEAARRGVKNLRLMIGRAEDLEAPPASFELITIGEAFHRLDQKDVAAKSLQLLKPGRCLASMGCYSILSAREPWQKVILDLVHRWTGRQSPGGSPSGRQRPGIGPENDERVFRGAGFVDVESYPFTEPHEWTVDAILGYLYSTSVCSKAVLGKKVEAFEAELKIALFAHDPGGKYRERIQWGYTLGRRPA